ncbi:MAG: putative metal-dependent hydrolase [Gemmatimonadetes bacterium]|nr:putative metal-dependent hydrolase [Gemmatimonadota bacterium]
MSDLRYPIGKFQLPSAYTPPLRSGFIADIERAPGALRAAVAGLSPGQLDTPYRPGGWTVRQVVHHVPDSHMNAYVRTKLALTEDEPTIKPYEEARWAELIDGRSAATETSLTLLEMVHARWVMLLRSLTPEQLGRRLRHPEHTGPLTLDWMLAMYAWHGRHHVAHITSLREREGWR